MNEPLGEWLDKQESDWLWLYSESEDRLYRRSGPVWRNYLAVERRQLRGSKPTFVRWDIPLFISEESLSPPDDAFPAEVMRKPNTEDWLLLDVNRTNFPSQETAQPRNLDEAVEALNEQNRWAIQHLQHDDDGEHFAQAIMEGQAIVVSDGSYAKGRTTAGFVATRMYDARHRLKACNEVAGTIKQQNAYRGELAGVYGGLTLTELICELHQVRGGKIKIALDGEAAMKMSFGHDPLSHKAPSADLVQAVRFKAWQLKIKYGLVVEFTWVEGHQKDKYNRETHEGMLN